MNPLAILILIVIAAVAAMTMFLLLIKLIDTFLSFGAPYVGLDPQIIVDIAKLLQISSKDTVYDLGSGDGRVLIGLCELSPYARYVGFDIGLMPTFQARIKIARAGFKAKIKIRQANFLSQDLGQASRVFTYLFPRLMDELLPKLERQLTAGTLLVSCDYPFSGKKPIKIVELKQNKSQRCHTLYLYKF